MFCSQVVQSKKAQQHPALIGRDGTFFPQDPEVYLIGLTLRLQMARTGHPGKCSDMRYIDALKRMGLPQ